MSERGQPTGSFECRVERRDDCVWVSLSGELDFAGRWKFESAVASVNVQAPGDVVLDLRGLRFIDSTGRGAIWDFARDIPLGKLRIIPGARNVQRLFELTGLTSLLPFVTSDAPR